MNTLFLFMENGTLNEKLINCDLNNKESVALLEEVLRTQRVYEFITVNNLCLLSGQLVESILDFTSHSKYFIVPKEEKFGDDDVKRELDNLYNIGDPLLCGFIREQGVFRVKGIGNLSEGSKLEPHQLEFYDPKPFLVNKDFSVTQRRKVVYNRGQENVTKTDLATIIASPPTRRRVTIFVNNSCPEWYHVPEDLANVSYILEVEKWAK